MNATTMNSGEPTYTDNGNTVGSAPYSLKFIFVIVFLLITLCYGSYIYKRGILSRSSSPPQRRAIAFIHTNNNNHVDDNNHPTRLSQGLDDDILITFPTFVYSEAIMKEHMNLNFTDVNSSGCSICLADYKAKDVIRLLPECGHLFHVKCIDTWLKAHPTCPVCRKSPLSIV